MRVSFPVFLSGSSCHGRGSHFRRDKIVARDTWTATHRGAFLGVAPTGKQIAIRTIDIRRVDGDKLAEHWDVIDLSALEKQLRES